MTKPTFNPALPYTFEDTEEDKRELRKALVEWCEITEKFEDTFLDSLGYSVRWSPSNFDYENKTKQKRNWEPINMYRHLECPVTYTPPEAIKVIMSGEKFTLLDKRQTFYFEDFDEYIYLICDEKPCWGLKEFLFEFENWHTATLQSNDEVTHGDEVTLCDEVKLVEEKKPEARIFKDWQDFSQNCDYLNHPGIKITFQNGFTKIIENYWPQDKHDIYLQAAFDAGATVELVEG